MRAGATGRQVQAAVFWAAGLAILLSALALGANRPVSAALLALILGPLLALQLLLDLASPLPRAARAAWPLALLWLSVLAWAGVQVLPAPWPGLAHPAWAAVADLPGVVPRISADPEAGLRHLLRLGLYGAAFWIGLRGLADPARARGFLRLTGLFAAALAAYGLWAALGGDNPILGIEDRPGVVTASFPGRNAWAGWAGIGLLASLAVLARGLEGVPDPRRLVRSLLRGEAGGVWIAALAALVCALGIVLSQSRMGTAVALVGMVVFLRSRGGGAAGGRTLLLLVAGLVLVAGLSGAGGLIERLIFTADENGRLAVYPALIAGLAERPLLGHGLGAFQDTFRAHLPLAAASAEWDLAHSSWLETAWELGLPAAGLLVLACALIGARLMRGPGLRRRDRDLPALALAAGLAAALHATVDFTLQIPATACLLALILGMGWAQSFPTAERG